MFNVKRQDLPDTKRYMDPKAKPFGGPSERVAFDTSKRKTLEGYQRVISRNADFEGGKFNTNYDPTWKAITRDIISRSNNKKPFEPVMAKTTIATTPAVVEETKIARFEQFVAENFNADGGFNMFQEAEEEETPGMPGMPGEDEGGAEGGEPGMEPEVDEEKVQALLDECSKDLNKLIEKVCKKLEVEREEAINLIKAAVPQVQEEAEEEEAGNEENGDAGKEEGEEEETSEPDEE